jgi:hypothetical protein
MSRGKGGNRRIHTIADDRQLGPSTLDGVSFDVPVGPLDRLVTPPYPGDADCAARLAKARRRFGLA